MLNTGKDGMMVFEPAFLKVNKGDTITFLPTDAGHDSVSAYVPEGAEGWAGENSKKISVTLNTEGVYLYKCIPHLMMGMVGVIQVGEATNKAEAEKEAEKMGAIMAMGKDRFSKYLAEVK
ncbi:MAG: pseudoazurin [Methylophaga sp.]|nr:MAG: pseudoazurin [Methylophaga sp.]